MPKNYALLISYLGMTTLLAALACGNISSDKKKSVALNAESKHYHAMSTTDSVMRLIDSLRVLPGTFVRDRGTHRYELSGADGLVNHISSYGDVAVELLVNCLDRADSTSVTLNGKRVLLGILCSQALYRTASYEATDDEGATNPD